MAKLNLFYALLLAIVLLPVHACSENNTDRSKAVFETLPEIRDIRPEKPVKIKLKRKAAGSYTWELKGDNAEKVIETDAKLREAFELQ